MLKTRQKQPRHSGRLKVTVHSLDGTTHATSLFIVGQTTLFHCISEACTSIFGNLTTQRDIKTRQEDWQIINYNRDKNTLEVFQIAGDPLIIVKDDPLELAIMIVKKRLSPNFDPRVN